MILQLGYSKKNPNREDFTAVLAGNDTFMTKNITQDQDIDKKRDRKRFITQLKHIIF